MSSAFDLDKASAAAAEAAGDPFTFTWAGESFTVPPAKQWTVAIVAPAAAGQIIETMELLLGDQWEAFRKGEPTLATIEALFQAVAADQGLTPGE